MTIDLWNKLVDLAKSKKDATLIKKIINLLIPILLINYYMMLYLSV